MRLAAGLLLSQLAALLMSLPAVAQTDLDRARNLVRCLEGRYPALCRMEWLTPTELEKTREAQRKANLETCSSGRLSSLCRKDLLMPVQREQVVQAERKNNAKLCASGRTPYLCNKTLLSKDQLAAAEAAERDRNAELCGTGRTPYLCKKTLLTKEQLATAEAAEAKAASERQSLYMPPASTSSSASPRSYGRNYGGGCGSRGGPGWRKPNGKCASWRD